MATTFIGSSATSYITGSNETDRTQTLLTIENSGSTSPVIVKITKLVYTRDNTFLEGSDIPLLQLCRLTGLPTGGTILDKTPFDTLSGSNASVIVRGGSSFGGDGVRGVALTKIDTSVKSVAWSTLSQKFRNLEVQRIYDDRHVLPEVIKNKPYILLPNESISVRLYDVPYAFDSNVNISTMRHLVQCTWKEESI